MSFIVTLARWLSPDFKKIARSTGITQVLTISISHYAEFACWALQLGGVQFKEYGYAPAQHVLPVLSLRVGDKAKHLSSTSRVMDVGEQSTPLLSEEDQKRAKRKDASTRSTAVPVAVLPDGRVLVDSWEIAAYSGLAPIDPALKKILDEEVGPLSRQLAYSRLLQKQNLHFLDQICTINRSWIWRMLWWAVVAKSARGILSKTYKPDDKAAADAARDRLKVIFVELEAILQNRPGRYLGGDTMGVADVALAALTAPLVNPPLYCHGTYGKIFDAFLEHDALAKAETNYWRETVVGKYVLEMYQAHRL